MTRLLDALAFSSVWVGLAAGALCAAASLALGVSPRPAVVGVAFAGTLVVYNVDRLRDLERDRATAPLRSAFVAGRRTPLALLVGAAAAASIACTLALGPAAFAVLVPVLALGLLHRRLKGIAYAKSAYITAAWLAVLVGLPAALAPQARGIPQVAAPLGLALFANAVASSLRDREGGAARHGPRPALRVARACAALGILAGAVAPPPARALVAVPAATLAALVPSRVGERYGLIVVDGALLAGALVALAILAG